MSQKYSTTNSSTSGTTSPEQRLGIILEQHQASRILYCGEHKPRALIAWEQTNSACRTTQLPRACHPKQLIGLGHFDIAIVTEQIEYLERSLAIELIGQIRNAHSNHLCLFVKVQNCDWTRDDFYALGMRLGDIFYQDDRLVHLYTYNVESYNHIRAWNNSRFWANPENFSQYWW